MKPWHFIGIAILLLGVAILGLRQNNINAYNMRDRLMARDRAGEDVREEVETELREFVFTHMNASLRIVLDGGYSREIARIQSEADQSIDSSVYEEAADSCDREGQLTTENARCVQEYVERHIEGEFDVALPSIDGFSYTYRSPIWTTDVPGWALAGAILSGLVGVGLSIRNLLLK